MAACQTPPAAEPPKPVWLPEVNRQIQAVLTSVEAEEAKFAEPPKPHDKEWVRRKLQHMVNIDQMVRTASEDPKLSGWSPDARRHFNQKRGALMGKIDRANTAELKELLKIHHWFTVSEFGEKVDNLAWLLVQHADHDVAFQQQVLGILTELHAKGETRPSSYAYLWDRVAGHTGKKQRYGTQGRCIGPGVWEPFEIEDPANLEKRRAGVGLPSMQVYRKIFRERGLCP